MNHHLRIAAVALAVAAFVPASGHAAEVVTVGLGGSVYDALDAARGIRAAGDSTMVPAGQICASACVLRFFGGRPRTMGAGAILYFHYGQSPRRGGGSKPDAVSHRIVADGLQYLGAPPLLVDRFRRIGPEQSFVLTRAQALGYGVIQ